VNRFPLRRTADVTATVRTPVDGWAALLAGASYLGLAVAVRGEPAGAERALFRATNHDMPTLRLLRVPQQLGTPWVLPALAVGGFVTHRPHLAVAAAFALPLEKGLEVGVKKSLQRSRPAAVEPEAELRDDAPREGSSYPSGHAAIAMTAVLLVRPYLPWPAAAAGIATAVTAGWVRVRQGAHFPVDALGGGLLAVAVTSTLRAVLGRPARPRSTGPGH
jgi:undecaprenyl-diphosphatase